MTIQVIDDKHDKCNGNDGDAENADNDVHGAMKTQIPLAEVYNDARRNVIVAIIIAGGEDIPEVCIFFANRLLRANRAVKVDRHEHRATILRLHDG